jgi:hypothetical protein
LIEEVAKKIQLSTTQADCKETGKNGTPPHNSEFVLASRAELFF